MTDINIVVEGPADAKLLRKYLPNIEGVTTRYYASGGKVSLATMARNLLVHEEALVLVVMDADVFNPQAVEQRRQMEQAALRQIATDDRFDVFAFCPAHEVIFFEAPEVLKRYWPQEDQLSASTVERGLYMPGYEFKQLLGVNKSPVQWLDRLTQEDGEILRQGAQASRLVAMFEALVAKGFAAA